MSSQKDVLHSTVFSCCRKAGGDCLFLTKDGREFQARAAAAGNARSPRVCRRIAGTISVVVAADRRRLQELRLVVKCRVSARYHGAVPQRNRKASVVWLQGIMLHGVHIDATWRIQSNDLCLVAMWAVAAVTVAMCCCCCHCWNHADVLVMSGW